MKKSLLFWMLAMLVCMNVAGQNTGDEKYQRHWQAGHEKIRIISYNIFNGFDYKKDADRRDRLVDWVVKQDPEVLALQELCGFTEGDLLKLAQRWGHSYAAIVKENGYPVGITSKKPIEVVNRLLENCGHGLLHVKTYGYDFLVTHLNPSSTEKRRVEAKNIAKYIEDNKLEKCLLMGDLNSHSPFDADGMERESTSLLMKYGGKASANLLDGDFDYSVISTFLSVPLIDVCRKFTEVNERTTFPTPVLMYLSRNKNVQKLVGERLDYIFVSPSLFKNVVDGFIYNGPENDFLSDHYPVGIDLCVKNK